MSHRLAPVLFLLLSTSCLTPPPVPAKSSSTSGSSTSSGSSASSGGACGQFKIQSKSDLDACKNKCRDQERDQMKSCTGAGCQGGAGTAACLSQCDDGQKAAQQGKCYKDS